MLCISPLYMSLSKSSYPMYMTISFFNEKRRRDFFFFCFLLPWQETKPETKWLKNWFLAAHRKSSQGI